MPAPFLFLPADLHFYTLTKQNQQILTQLFLKNIDFYKILNIFEKLLQIFEIISKHFV